jgi:hypothetical protein
MFFDVATMGGTYKVVVALTGSKKREQLHIR